MPFHHRHAGVPRGLIYRARRAPRAAAVEILLVNFEKCDRSRDDGRGRLFTLSPMVLIVDGVGTFNSENEHYRKRASRRVARCINLNLVGRIMQKSRVLMAAAALCAVN